MAVLRKVWAVMDAPAGKRMTPFLPDILDRLRAYGELDITDELAAKACQVSAATLVQPFAPERKKLELKGRAGTEPGTLLKSQNPDPDLGGLERTDAGVCRDRLRRARGRRLLLRWLTPATLDPRLTSAGSSVSRTRP